MDEPHLPPQESSFIFIDSTEDPKAWRPELVAPMDDGSIVFTRQCNGHEVIERAKPADMRRVAGQLAALADIAERGLLDRFKPGEQEPPGWSL